MSPGRASRSSRQTTPESWPRSRSTDATDSAGSRSEDDFGRWRLSSAGCVPRSAQAATSRPPPEAEAGIPGWRACPATPGAIAENALRRHVAVDVLIEATVVGARVPPEAAVRVLRATLLDVGAVGVRVSALTRIRTGHDVAPVGPDAVRERPDRADVQIVARERERSAAELLVVRVRRNRAQTGCGCPGIALVSRPRSVGVECRPRHSVGAVPHRPHRAVAGVVPAIP